MRLSQAYVTQWNIFRETATRYRFRLKLHRVTRSVFLPFSEGLTQQPSRKVEQHPTRTTAPSVSAAAHVTRCNSIVKYPQTNFVCSTLRFYAPISLRFPGVLCRERQRYSCVCPRKHSRWPVGRAPAVPHRQTPFVQDVRVLEAMGFHPAEAEGKFDQRLSS